SDERLVAEVLAIERQDVEGDEDGFNATAQQIVELRSAFGVETNDLTIEDGLGSDHARERLRQRCKAAIHIAIAREQPALPRCDLSDSPEAVIFQFEDPVRGIKR